MELKVINEVMQEKSMNELLEDKPMSNSEFISNSINFRRKIDK